MGSDEPTFKLWQPAHKVTLDTFCIDMYEVTAADYKACSDMGECKRPPDLPEFPKADTETPEQHDKIVKAYMKLADTAKREDVSSAYVGPKTSNSWIGSDQTFACYAHTDSATSASLAGLGTRPLPH